MSSKKIQYTILLMIFFGFFYVQSVDAFEINGTVYDSNYNVLENTNISVRIRNQSWADLGSNTTTTNASGWFNLTIPDNQTYMFELSIVHINQTSNYVDYVGQSVPALPYMDFSMLANVSYYLKQAGTINITVLNGSNNITSFGYQVKDKKLGYEISSCTSNQGLNETICYVPIDRNYSVMVYPGQNSESNFVPVSFEWYNFSSSSSYTFGLSDYNATTRTVNKQFNVTESFARISGYLNSTSLGIDGWEEFTIAPLLFEPGGMIFMQYGVLPFNASAWNMGETDIYNLTTGFYNITLPYSSGETVRYILFAAAKNGTYYGSYRNITVTGDAEINFTMQGLLGDNSTITMQDSVGGPDRVVNTSKQYFYLVNASDNSSLSNMNAHIEITVDYSDYGATEFTFMEDLSAPNNGNFSIPLLNVSGIKEINVYTMDMSPKRVSSKSASEIIANNNISLSSFDPGDIEDVIGEGDIFVALYRSSQTCNIPNPAQSCVLADTSSLEEFNPIAVIMGGGDISFRIVYQNVTVHYSNVDMLASGPPDALFDNDINASTSSGDQFGAVMRFGSEGPTIYDSILISIPYNDSVGGLNDTEPVNVSINLFYDEDWNIIWNTSENGTSGTELAGNYSHYAEYSTEWGYLMTNTTCANYSNSSYFNTTNPCYINTTSNQIWVRLPHFSGTGPTITGSIISAAASEEEETTSSSGGGGGGGGGSSTPSNPKSTRLWSNLNIGEEAKMSIDKQSISVNEVKFKLLEQAKNVKVTVEVLAEKPNTTTDPEGTSYQFMEITAENLNQSMLDGSVAVKFKINNSWFTGELKQENIALYRYTNTWNKLETKYITKDENHTYFEASTPGFSTFVISAKEETTQEPEPAVCGNNECDEGETEASCPEDCKTEKVCTPGEIICDDNNLLTCNAEGIGYSDQIFCEHGCDSLSMICNEAQIKKETKSPLIIWSLVIIIIVVIAISLFMFLHNKKPKSRFKKK